MHTLLLLWLWLWLANLAFVRQHSCFQRSIRWKHQTPSRFDSTQGVRSSTNIRGPSRMFRDRPRMFVDLEASRVSRERLERLVVSIATLGNHDV